MPSTITSASEFLVASDLKRCWGFFADLRNIGHCIPGCESVDQVDDKTAIFRVRVKVGYISKSFELKVRFSEISPPSRLVFVGEGNDAEVQGSLELLQSADARQVKANYKIEIRPVSAMGKTALVMVGKDLVKKQAEDFAACVKSRLETGPLPR